jgi:tetratricopeptide (TPR) repeat protein
MYPRRLPMLVVPLVLMTGLLRADDVELVPDSTIKTPGNRIRGQITAETPAAVKIKPGVGAEQSIPVDQIKAISYDNTTPSFTLAQTRENAGMLTEAIDLYKRALTEASGKPFVAEAARFARARILADAALADPARADAAIAELDAAIKAHPNSRHLGPTLIQLIRLELQKGNAARAQAALGELKSKVPWATTSAAVLEARLLSKAGKNDQAIAKLDQIIKGAEKGSVQAREALLAKSEALVAAQKYDEAAAAVRQVIEQSPAEDDRVQALAHNTLGDAYRAAGRPKDALLEYLKTDILYDGNKEQHPRALAQIAQLWRELKQDARADETIEKLRQQYPQSPYANARNAPR